MKVIDLLNKIANETQPKIIIFDTEKYIWEKEQKEYRRYPYENNLYYSLWSDYDLTKCLNEEVEVLEEDKEIEELDMCYSDELKEYIVQTHINGNHYKEIYNSRYDELIINKINELIKAVNELKKGK